jgi:hypothetical protein
MSEFSGWSFALGVAVGVAQLMLRDWIMFRRWRKQDQAQRLRGPHMS